LLDSSFRRPIAYESSSRDISSLEYGRIFSRDEVVSHSEETLIAVHPRLSPEENQNDARKGITLNR